MIDNVEKGDKKSPNEEYIKDIIGKCFTGFYGTNSVYIQVKVIEKDPCYINFWYNSSTSEQKPNGCFKLGFLDLRDFYECFNEIPISDYKRMVKDYDEKRNSVKD